MAPGTPKGRGAKRPNKQTRERKGPPGRSAWVKPDGTPLRKRKGDYFPDREIEKRAPAFRKKRDDAQRTAIPGGEMQPAVDKREYRDRDESKPPRESRPPFARDGKREFKKRDDRPERPARENKFGKDRGTSRPSFARGAKKEYKKRDDRPERPTRENSFSKDRDTTRPAFGRDEKKEFRKRDDREERPARENSFSKDRDSSRPAFARDDKKDFRKRDDREERPARENKFGKERDSSGPFRADRPAPSGDFKSRYGKKPSRDSKPSSGNREATGGYTSDKPYSKGPSDRRKPSYDKFRRDRRDAGPHRERKPKSSTPSVTGAIRLNKYISNAGICSRREADDLITAGVISINGEIVTELGTKVMPDDVVKFHEQTLRTEKPVYVLLNKPKDFITTTDDPQERKTVMNLVQDACKERILPVGRLDRNTTGLLLFTNDGELTKRLTHPSGNIQKIYTVELDRNISRDDMQRTLDGIELEDGPAAFDAIEFDVSGEKNIVGVELHSGRNRVVRRIFEGLGYNVKKLDRVMFAGLTKKDLPRGRWRFLTEIEVSALKMMTGRKK